MGDPIRIAAGGLLIATVALAVNRIAAAESRRASFASLSKTAAIVERSYSAAARLTRVIDAVAT